MTDNTAVHIALLLAFLSVVAVLSPLLVGVPAQHLSPWVLSGSSSADTGISPLHIPSSSHRSVPTPLTYNRQAAVGYAYKWWNGANTPKYNDYSDSGGDCANFVSQCLIAGGISLHKGTDGTGYGVYPDKDRTSYSHGTIPYCDYLNLNLRNYQNTSVTYVTDDSPSVPDEVTIGDVVIFGDKNGDMYKHAMLVVWDGGTEVGLSGHSSPVWNRTFSQELSYFSCATFYHFLPGTGEYHHFRVNTGTLNVRVGPGKNGLDQYYEDIGDIHSGEEYVAFGKEVVSSGSTWWHFWFDDRAAWCSASYTVEVTGNTPFEVDVSNYLNVRDGPGTDNAIYGQVYSGMRFISDYKDGDWYRFWYSGTQKYSYSGYTTALDEGVQQNQTTNSTPGNIVMGYLPYWVSTSGINYSALTDLAWFSVDVNADGSLGNTHGWPDWDVINNAHAAGCRVILTATLMSSTDIHTLISTPSYRTTCINNLLSQVQTGNADGVNIDFEMPKTSGDDAYLVQFMSELNSTFKAADPSYQVSIAGPSVDWWGTWDYGALSEHLDYFMIMAYGYYYGGSSKAGPTSPLDGGSYNIKNTIAEYTNGGAPRSKILLGLPFYGYDYPVEDQTEQSSTRGSGSSRTYSSALSLIDQYSASVNYDSTFECPWFNYYKSGDGWHQVWFDNYTSLERKFTYARDENLGGIGIWAWGYQGSHHELDSLVNEKFGEDTQAPTVHIIQPSNGSVINSSQVNISWSGGDDRSLGRYLLSVDGGVMEDMGLQNYNIVDLSDGWHTITVKAVDQSGNSATDSISIVVDTCAPVITYISPQEGAQFTTPNVTAYWSADDTSGIQSFSVSLDNAPATDIGQVNHYEMLNLSLGTHQLIVTALDNANFTSHAALNFSIVEESAEDTEAPHITITDPDNGFMTSTDSVEVHWIGSDNTGISGYQVSLDSQSWIDVGQSLSYQFTAITEGSHMVSVQGRDLSGNVGTASINITVDMSPPAVNITSPTNNSVLNSTEIIVSFQASDSITGISSIEYRLDGFFYLPVSSGDTTIVLTSLSMGTHLLDLRATDGAGNTQTASCTFQIDPIPPSLEIISPSEGSIINSSDYEVRINATDNNCISWMEYKVDNGEWTDTENQLFTLHSSDGEHTLSVKVYDEGGNSVEALVHYTVDSTGPVIYITSPANGTVIVGFSVTVSWNASDNGTGLDSVLLIIDDSKTFVSDNSTFQITSLSEGVHHISLEATDRAGHTSSAAIEIRVVHTDSSSNFTVELGPLTFRNGSPVEGASITLSTGEGSFTAATDTDGMSVFTLSPGLYQGNVDYEGSEYFFPLILYTNGSFDVTLPVIEQPSNSDNNTGNISDNGTTGVGGDTGTLNDSNTGNSSNGTADSSSGESSGNNASALSSMWFWLILILILVGVAVGIAVYLRSSKGNSESDGMSDEDEDEDEDADDDSHTP